MLIVHPNLILIYRKQQLEKKGKKNIFEQTLKDVETIKRKHCLF